MLFFRLSWFVLQFQSLPAAFSNVRVAIEINVTLIIDNFLSTHASSLYYSIFLFSLIFTKLHHDCKFSLGFFKLLLHTNFGFQTEISECFCFSKSKKNLPSHSVGQILDYAYSMKLLGKIIISCKIPDVSPPSSRCVQSYTLFAPVCCIRLLYD